MELKVICKRLITQNLDGNITEGEYGADVVGISVPRMYGEHDLSAFSFRLTAVSKLNESVAEQVLTMDSIDNDNIHLLWEVTSDFTVSSGEVTLTLAGVNADNSAQIKFISQPVTINDDYRLEFIESPTILEQAYNQVQLEVQRAVDAAERAEEAAAGIVVPIATETDVGGIISGGDISVDENGAVTVNSVKGKTIGASVPEDAVFTDTVYTLPVASDFVLGGVKVDNDTIKINSDGVICSVGEPKTENGRTLSGSSSYTIDDGVDYPILALNLYGKSVQDGTPTADAPIDIVSVGDDRNINIANYGGVDFFGNQSLEYGTFGGDGSPVDITTVVRTAERVYLEAGTYIISIQNAKRGIGYRYTDATVRTGTEIFTWGENNIPQIFTLTENAYCAFAFNNVPGTGDIVLEDVTDIKIQACNQLTVTSALPLCSVGDVCDELIYNADGTGKIVKRTAKIDSYNGETITTDYISSTGGLNTGAEVVYVLEHPTETALSASEITMPIPLQTFDGVTNIYNDEGAEMAMKIAANPLLSEYVMPVIEGLTRKLIELEAVINA